MCENCIVIIFINKRCDRRLRSLFRHSAQHKCGSFVSVIRKRI